jgi:hypothetical protein
MNQLRALWIVAAVVLISSSAYAVTDGDLKREAKPDDAAVRKLETTLVDSDVTEELEEADSVSFDAAAKELAAQERSLKADTIKIQQKIVSLKAGKERAKQEVELNRKQMEFQRAKNFAARKAAVQALAVKTVFVQQNTKLSQELRGLEADQRATEEETRKLDTFIRMAQAERRDLLNRRQQTKANIEAQKQAQKIRRAQYDAYRKATKDLEKHQEANAVEQPPTFGQSASLGSR